MDAAKATPSAGHYDVLVNIHVETPRRGMLYRLTHHGQDNGPSPQTIQTVTLLDARERGRGTRQVVFVTDRDSTHLVQFASADEARRMFHNGFYVAQSDWGGKHDLTEGKFSLVTPNTMPESGRLNMDLFVKGVRISAKTVVLNPEEPHAVVNTR